MSRTSGVSAFVGGRHKSANDEQPVLSAEQQERMQAIVSDMGLRSQLLPNTADVRISSRKKNERVPSRQAVADRSRVPTPAFPFQRVPSQLEAGAQRPQADTLMTNSVGQTQLPLHGLSSAKPEPRSLFDTDSEAADDSTRYSAFTEHDSAPVARNVASGNKTHQGGMLSKHGASQLSQESLAYYSRDRDAIAGSPHQRGFESIDDDLDDQTQYEPSTLDVNQMQDRHSPVESTTSSTRKRKINQAAPHQGTREEVFGYHSRTPNGARVTSLSGFTGSQNTDSHMAPSDKSVSISSREEQSDMEDTKSLHSAHSDDYSRVIHDNTQGSVPATTGISMHQPPTLHHNTAYIKEEYIQERGPVPIISPLSPGPTLGRMNGEIAAPDQKDNPDGFPKQSISHQAKSEVSLDYDMKALGTMTFQQLADESFDTAPQPTKLGKGTMALKEGLTLDKKLLHLHALNGSREDVQAQRQAFFSSLPIDQHEECGDLMADHFSQILSKLKTARQQKRGLAKEFEKEVAARQKLVERRRLAVTEDLDRLKRAGQDVVGRR
ncbi:MAG: hypothetical protein Q9204_007963 [Flavoplaca sp. TL-2023a]